MSSFRFMNNNETTNNPSSNFNNNNNNNTSSSSSSSSSPFTNSSAFNTSSPFNNTNTTDQDSEDLSMSDTEMSDAPVEQQIMQELQQHQQQLQEQQELQQTSVPGAMAIPQKTKAQADLDYQRALLQQKLADKSVFIPVPFKSSGPFQTNMSSPTSSGSSTTTSSLPSSSPFSSPFSSSLQSPGSGHSHLVPTVSLVPASPVVGESGDTAGVESPPVPLRGLLAPPSSMISRSSHLATSPTDKMMSPCSQKLAERKNKQFGMQSKPLLLSKAFSQASAQKNSKEKEQKRGGLFGSAPVKAEDPIF